MSQLRAAASAHGPQWLHMQVSGLLGDAGAGKALPTPFLRLPRKSRPLERLSPRLPPAFSAERGAPLGLGVIHLNGRTHGAERAAFLFQQASTYLPPDRIWRRWKVAVPLGMGNKA